MLKCHHDQEKYFPTFSRITLMQEDYVRTFILIIFKLFSLHLNQFQGFTFDEKSIGAAKTQNNIDEPKILKKIWCYQIVNLILTITPLKASFLVHCFFLDCSIYSYCSYDLCNDIYHSLYCFKMRKRKVFLYFEIVATLKEVIMGSYTERKRITDLRNWDKNEAKRLRAAAFAFKKLEQL